MPDVRIQSPTDRASKSLPGVQPSGFLQPIVGWVDADGQLQHALVPAADTILETERRITAAVAATVGTGVAVRFVSTAGRCVSQVRVV